MPDRFVSTSYHTRCYHCGEETDQLITAVPYQARVACASCGATRVFIPRIEDVSEKGSYTRPGCFDIWELAPDAICRHCGSTGAHDLVIGCRQFTVRCRNCGFTHFYRFDIEYMAGAAEPV
jgi:uncharacterized Zn finger protein